RFRIPAGVIGTVQNRCQLVRILPQHDVQPATTLGRLDFTPIMLTDGRHFVGEQNSALEEIEFPKKLDATEREKAFVQIGQPKIESPKTPLVGNVMDRENGRKWKAMGFHVNRH